MLKLILEEGESRAASSFVIGPVQEFGLTVEICNLAKSIMRFFSSKQLDSLPSLSYSCLGID